MADKDRPQLKEVSDLMSEEPKPTPEPTPEPESGVRKVISNIMDRASNVTTGGAKSVVEGAMKHF